MANSFVMNCATDNRKTPLKTIKGPLYVYQEFVNFIFTNPPLTLHSASLPPSLTVVAERPVHYCHKGCRKRAGNDRSLWTNGCADVRY